MFSTPFTSMSVGAVSAGALLGTSGNNALLSSINESLGGSTFFGSMKDTFRESGNFFIENIVRPIQRSVESMANVINILMNPDTFRSITEVDQLKAIPPCMQEPLIMFPPLRKLLEQGRISGFGYDPDHLPKEDTWGRLIDNGCCHDLVRGIDSDGDIPLDYHWESTDPVHELDDLDHVEMTRNFILKILQTTMLDPTDVPNERG